MKTTKIIAHKEYKGYKLIHEVEQEKMILTTIVYLEGESNFKRERTSLGTYSVGTIYAAIDDTESFKHLAGLVIEDIERKAIRDSLVETLAPFAEKLKQVIDDELKKAKEQIEKPNGQSKSSD